MSKTKKPQPSESVRILLALIDANLEIARKYDFEGYSYRDEADKKSYESGFKAGALSALGKLKEQIGGYDE